MTERTRRRLLLALALLAFTLGACGGDDESAQTAATPEAAESSEATPTPTPEPTPEPLSNRELVNRMNELCGEGNELIGEAYARANAASEAGDVQGELRSLRRVARLFERFTREMGELEPSDADAPAFRRYMRAVRRTTAGSRRQVQAVAEGDYSEVEILEQSAMRERERRLNAALDLGADKCGQAAADD